MATAVVSLLEPIEMEAEQRELSSTGGHKNRFFHTFAEQHPVGQLRQGIVARHEQNACLELMSLGNVLVRGHPTAFGHRMMRNVDKAAVSQRHHQIRGLLGSNKRL